MYKNYQHNTLVWHRILPPPNLEVWATAEIDTAVATEQLGNAVVVVGMPALRVERLVAETAPRSDHLHQPCCWHPYQEENWENEMVHYDHP